MKKYEITQKEPEGWEKAFEVTVNGEVVALPYDDGCTKTQWLQARKDLGLDKFITPEEERTYSEIEPMTPEEEEAMTPVADAPKRSKYHVEIKTMVWVDVYDVLIAYNVTNPADAHAIKKMLMPGQRGAKSAAQDREEAIASLVRAGELER